MNELTNKLTDKQLKKQYYTLRLKARKAFLKYTEIVQLENCQLEINKRNLKVKSEAK